MASSSQALEYLELLPRQTHTKLYEQPSTVLAIFRCMLPHLGKLGVLSYSCARTNVRILQPKRSSWQCSTCPVPSPPTISTPGSDPNRRSTNSTLPSQTRKKVMLMYVQGERKSPLSPRTTPHPHNPTAHPAHRLLRTLRQLRDLPP